MKIALIGSGVMGEAFIAGLLRNHLADAKQITASDPLKERRQALEDKYGILTVGKNVEAIQTADVVILAVKPQHLDKVMADLHGKVNGNTLILSIVAGAPTNLLSDGLAHASVIRVMPNTPAQIGQGISVWTASPAVSDPQKELAHEILSSLGPDIFMEDEFYLDMATALSGTGPAYAFLFMEAMIDAGVHMGFQRNIAEKLVIQTMRGSVEYYDKKKAHPAELRNEVTSPGGTTAAAMYYLEKAGFRTAISRAIWAAYERSLELGRGKKSQPPEGNGA
ncbi:MAG: pyrroline-5-carboxylate reductase [Chloroflexi bacterium]|nr:pyrroline-5-carboxylate reductase [Chloroflexota bacterium]